MIFKGDSVRLQCHFKTFSGVSINPDNVELVIYDKAKNIIETIPITDENKTATGQYYYDYVVPDDIDEYFIFEYRGIHNTKPILAREKVNIKFN